ncbi:winged helix-turn-helix transcriptional regulator [Clostridium beijerinckii]|uniref:DNA-binding HxlR family transcriptional regulator n=1 Tax=Clostridium beijerinckii TaxID=1520 RepID=A0A9Q5CSW8_CLOBE|nr:helix-turn-helix domain-containing protein [Clostridium beijerinckii]AQS05826.1 HTH-type transcriptional activator HxlR [Clostridium beijerinckii]MBA2885457.1 DNA-binding HxlR family transcriptional regulator [Clostridium beijerinckii]MBA2900042.1 DNA-binding HxlR family transcriptional regulator [Clostridium beijerinckii]MBA2909671.1 DNA-binding HxlR family transcriptional regulator [Clostridium beijerinckii]MBA9014576.1 DNA-binding HxlR family transcriptional regulator [Clostridium beijer
MSKSIDLESNCPMNLTINILSGKWKIAILWHLSRGTIRFNELQRLLTNITQKTLTMQLRELERDGIIYREVYPESPPRVEYGLTSIGESMTPILSAMCDWGKGYKKLINEDNSVSLL